MTNPVVSCFLSESYECTMQSCLRNLFEYQWLGNSDIKDELCEVALLCNPGPGDTLRFINSFCEYLNINQKYGIIFCLVFAYNRCRRLIEKCINCGRGIILVEVKDEVELNLILKRIKNRTIFRSFEAEYFIKGTKIFKNEIIEGVDASIVPIDGYENYRYMRKCLSEHLPIKQNSNNSLSNTAIIFMRIMDIVPERNMNINILMTVIKLMEKNSINYVFAGSNVPKEYKKVINQGICELYPGEEFPDYYSQIEEYSKYLFAIGMNSGGLDLAAASGIPIIRIGEFQHTLKHMGENYNIYLNKNKTVNIRSNSERDISNITEEKIKYAFDFVLSDNKQGELIIC